jgi:hypothetical protein
MILLVYFDTPFLIADISWIRKAYPTAFIAVFDPSASEKPNYRASCFDSGANMVAHDVPSLVRTIEEAVIPAGREGGRLTCPYCSLKNLSSKEMWYHCPAYHINWPNEQLVTNNCPICREQLREPLQVLFYSSCSRFLLNHFLLCFFPFFVSGR